MNNRESPTNTVVWHTQSITDVAATLKVDIEQGLTSPEAQSRLQQHGRNVLREGKRRGPWRMFFDQFTDVMVLILIGAALIAGFLGEVEDTIAIVIIILLNAVLGFVQEFRSERAMQALKAMAAAQARTLRSGGMQMIPAAELVIGDIVHLEAGVIVPADMRLVHTTQLRIEEAALTGESNAIEKNADANPAHDAALGDRFNMAFKGTHISYGRGTGIVVATGMQTQLGNIATLLHAQEDSKTPLQKRLATFGQRLAIIAIILCALIFFVGILRGEKPLLMFMTALSLAVAAIPEALPAVVTLSLAFGAKRMITRHVLIRRLPAVETLGSVTYICSDKTGTLTQNRMRAVAYCLHGTNIQTMPESIQETQDSHAALAPLLHAMALNNDAVRDDKGHAQGDPTETALLEAAELGGFTKSKLEKELPRMTEIPFSSERGMMSTIHGRGDHDFLLITKGAPERVIPLTDRPDALESAQLMAREGLRVLAVAQKKLTDVPAEINPENIEADLELIGMIGLLDPPRPGVKEAVSLCLSASMKVVMITGDHPATAVAIARSLGIIDDDHPHQGEHGPVLTGRELAQLPEEEFKQRVRDVRIYARVSPEQKINIVQALQEQGEFVAMTGDGVNDAPALKRADIGIAMGKMGTDVAREAAHMVLLDDDFSSIVSAVREGRRIFDNIRKFIRFVLAGNAAEILTLLLAPLFGLPVPFLPIHILWINLVTDGLPGLALSAEQEEPNIMQRPPRSPRESIFAHGLWQHTLWAGILMAVICLSIGKWAYDQKNDHWQTMIFTVITLTQMCHVLAVRSERKSIFTTNPFSNIPLLTAVIFTAGLQILLLYIPWCNKVFYTHPLRLSELALCLALAPLIVLLVETEKWMVRRGWIYQK